jgi:steroid delta-isomerase-like uncharacterized protein
MLREGAMADDTRGSTTTDAAIAQNIALVSRIWDEVWNSGDLEACVSIFSPDYVGHLPGMTAPVRGPAEFRQLVDVYRTAFPDVHLSVEDVLGAQDRVVVRWVSRGTHLGPMMGMPPSGRKMEIMGISIFRIADGLVAEEWEGFDTMSMMQQLGAAGSAG